MGLDIYFDKVPKGAKDKSNGEEVAYFRKVNFLVRFFNYEENCEFQPIEKSQIEKLLRYCDEVLKDNNKAETLLPTQGGFYFGNTEYNDYYFSDVEEVKKVFTEILEKIDFESSEIVMYCWW